MVWIPKDHVQYGLRERFLKKKKPISQVVATVASAFPHTCEKEKILFFYFFEKSCHHFSSVRASHSNKKSAYFLFSLPAGNGDEWMDTQTDCTRREREREGKKPFFSFSFRHRREKSSH